MALTKIKKSDILRANLREAFSKKKQILVSPYPFLILDKVAPAGTLGNPLWKDAVLDGLFGPLDNIGKFGIVGKVIELAAVGT